MADLSHLPRMALIELLVGQAISASTILWTELSQAGKCDAPAEDLVDSLVLSMVELEELKSCLKKSKTL